MLTQQLVIVLIFHIIVSGTNGGENCPVQSYVQRHVCEDCWTKEKAIDFAKGSNQHRKGKACLVHVFEGYKDGEKYRSERGQCITNQPVGGWMCTNVLTNNAECIPVKNCRPTHDHREGKDGRFYNPGVNCKPVLPLSAINEEEKCFKTCRGATATSRVLCSVNRAVAASNVCLVEGWFALGFSCVGAVGEASTFSEGCGPVIDFAEVGCQDLCRAIVTNNYTIPEMDYNKVLNDHICIVKETTRNYRWIDAVQFQGRVVRKQKEIIDRLDAIQEGALEENIQRIMKAGDGLLTELRRHRKRYDRMTYSEEGLLAINSQSDYFKHKTLQDNNLHDVVKELYKHISGIEIESIYHKESSLCNLETFNLMNSYLVQGHIMLLTALELGNKLGDVTDLTVTEYLNRHHAEYMTRCGCPPSGKPPYLVQTNIDPLIKALGGAVDMFAAPDVLLSVLPFVETSSYKGLSIIVKALAGTIQAHSGDAAGVMRKLSTMKTQIAEKSFKVCTDISKDIQKCTKHSHCIWFKNNCWCYVKSNQQQREACGYESGYSSTYYSIVSSGAPRDLIITMGLKPHSNYCPSNDNCHADCATNRCGNEGCWGTDLSCWTEQGRWARKIEGIVRCNYESI